MKSVETINPFSGEVIKSYELEDMELINSKINESRKSFSKWRKLSVVERVALLTEALKYFKIHGDSIAQEITDQVGKPLQQSKNEINGFFERAEYLLSIAESTLKTEILPKKEGLDRRILHEPLGCVLILAAWNYPLMIAVNGVLTALLCGNTVVLKHALATLSIGGHFEKAFGRIAGYEGLVKNIVTDHDTLAEVISESAIDHVVFTGSVRGGHAVYQSVAKRFINCHLELGGKDAAYVAEDCDAVKAAEGLVDGAMYNAGQSCCGIERVYVHEAVYDNFVKKCIELMAEYKLCDPNSDDCDMGPLINAAAAEVMEAQINEAIALGAKLICGGKRRIISGATFFEPTLIKVVNQSSSLMQEENFGPILGLMKVSDDTRAIELINDSEYGLTSAIFTNNDELAESFANEMNTGTVFQNRCDYLDPALPWTGVKNSGKGSGLSKYGFYGLTRRKSINFRL